MAQLFHLSGRAYENSSGVPYALAKAYFFVTGTTTAQDTYTTAALSVANANPVVAGADGVFGDIYLAAKRYKVRIDDADGNVLRTWDPVDATSQLIAASAAPSPTYPFLRYHNTSDGFVYRRNAADSAWINEGAVDSIGNAASVTETLTGTETAKLVTPDSLAALWQRGTNITPSAGTVSLPSTGGGVFNIAAGNFATISSAQGGRAVLFIFSGTSVITYDGTSMILPGGASITTEAGDCALFVNEAAADSSGTNWRCVWYQRDSTTLAPPVNYAASQSEVEAMSSALRWVTPQGMKWHPGVGKAYINFAGASAPTIAGSYGVTSLDDDGPGLFGVNMSVTLSSTAYAITGFAESVTAASTCVVSRTPSGAKSTTAFDVWVRRGSADTAQDSADTGVMVMGDL